MNPQPYEFKHRLHATWQRCTRAEAIALLSRFHRDPQAALDSIDSGGIVSTFNYDIRRFAPEAAPYAPRRACQIEEDGEILWA